MQTRPGSTRRGRSAATSRVAPQRPRLPGRRRAKMGSRRAKSQASEARRAGCLLPSRAGCSSPCRADCWRPASYESVDRNISAEDRSVGRISERQAQPESAPYVITSLRSSHPSGLRCVGGCRQARFHQGCVPLSRSLHHPRDAQMKRRVGLLRSMRCRHALVVVSQPAASTLLCPAPAHSSGALLAPRGAAEGSTQASSSMFSMLDLRAAKTAMCLSCTCCFFQHLVCCHHVGEQRTLR